MIGIRLEKALKECSCQALAPPAIVANCSLDSAQKSIECSTAFTAFSVTLEHLAVFDFSGQITHFA